MRELERFQLVNQWLCLPRRKRMLRNSKILLLEVDQLLNRPKLRLHKLNRLKLNRPKPNKSANKAHHLAIEFSPVHWPKQLLNKKASTFPKSKAQAQTAESSNKTSKASSQSNQPSKPKKKPLPQPSKPIKSQRK
jgi:hypothetical protein